jgi:hypothetical protein
VLSRIWNRHAEADHRPIEILDPEEFETELEKKVLRLLDMTLSEFRFHAKTGELPVSPAVDHLRFLAGV